MYRRKGWPVNKSSLCAFIIESESVSCSVISNSLRPHGLSMEFSGKNTGVGSNSLLQGIFPTQGSNPGLLHWRILYHLSYQGNLIIRFPPNWKQIIVHYLVSADWKQKHINESS